MAKAGKKLIAKLTNDDGDVVWVSKGGGDYWISHAGQDHICHRSAASLQGARREALLVFHVNVPNCELLE
ncbi:hypothetical protein [Sphingobium fuliginis]|uniref:Uncharacterized protein n=1 Tax=Sphingobium fuliginis ATCC 27551 TaxID=1208342 RepID=A0A5B8CBB1_SPHSA|nr:hypothetical protein [Sphingobium fuliginis]QDC36463.1 hypothetical protein FIL70_03595 [Sphingobium fuliginis ATCC 27551]